MFKKIIASFLILATSTVFGMSLNKLNSANKTELMEINGIGEAKAAAIIKERRKSKFKSFEDFQRVEGIGEQTASNVKNNVKSASDVKKVKKSTKKKTAKKVTKAKKSKTKKENSSKDTKKSKKRKIKSMDEKKKELKKKAKKTKTKKTKAKKTKKTKSKKKN